MKCPYCEKEMEEGFIPVRDVSLYWIPAENKMPISIFPPKHGIRLSKAPGLNGQKVTSNYCNSCKIVIIPVKEELYTKI